MIWQTLYQDNLTNILLYHALHLLTVVDEPGHVRKKFLRMNWAALVAQQDKGQTSFWFSFIDQPALLVLENAAVVQEERKKRIWMLWTVKGRRKEVRKEGKKRNKKSGRKPTRKREKESVHLRAWFPTSLLPQRLTQQFQIWRKLAKSNVYCSFFLRIYVITEVLHCQVIFHRGFTKISHG